MHAASVKEREAHSSAGRAFPLPTTNLYKILADGEYRAAFNARLKQGNRFMAPLYKVGILPLLGMGNLMMVLTTRGRKSNELRDTPIGYFRLDGIIYVFSGWGTRANWYKNMLACPDDVFLQVGLHHFHVRAELIEDPQAKRLAVERLIQQDPRGAKLLMGWDVEIDRPESADFSLMIEKVVIVRYHPQ